jgi:hypothetical protein
MSIWLDTRGRNTLGIGWCDRCKFKFSLDDLHTDRNTPGLKVCDRCNDQLDPYRLPARQPDDITLPFYRAQEPLIVPDEIDPESVAAGIATADANAFISPESPFGPPDGGMYGIEVTA